MEQFGSTVAEIDSEALFLGKNIFLLSSLGNNRRGESILSPQHGQIILG